MLWIAAGLIVSGYLIAGIINTLADSLPLGKPGWWVGCKNCLQTAGFFDYLFLKKCSACQVEPGLRRITLQIIFPVAFLFLWFFPPRNLHPLLAMVIFAYMALVFVIDLEHKEVYGVTNVVGLLLAIGTGIFYRGFSDTLVGGAVGFAVMAVFYLFGKVFVSLLNKRRTEKVDEVALGLGDVYVTLILGLFVGWPMILLLLMLAILSGGIVSAGILIFQKTRRGGRNLTAIPYTPFLLTAGAVLLYLIKPGA